tara:strand:+ start:530 stop:991 length:462 start_codon:yes stop_codon:yes gene_type:complete
MTKKKMNLTAKQLKFCELIGRHQHNLTSAYSIAYQCDNMKASTIRREACRLMDNDHIRTTIEKLKEETSRLDSIVLLSHKEAIIQKLRKCIDGEIELSQSQLTSAKLLGDTMALYKNVVVQESDSKSSKEIIDELTNKINKINTLQAKPDKLH